MGIRFSQGLWQFPQAVHNIIIEPQSIEIYQLEIDPLKPAALVNTGVDKSNVRRYLHSFCFTRKGRYHLIFQFVGELE